MYAISLHQPFASLIAIGLKQYETRNWPPPKWLIGKRIAIHATKMRVSRDDREWARHSGAVEVGSPLHDLPLGAVVCTAILAGAYQCGIYPITPHTPCTAILESLPGSPDLPGGVRVDGYGDYSLDRWAWLLRDVERFEPPIPARGKQGFWKFTMPGEAALLSAVGMPDWPPPQLIPGDNL